MAAGGPIARLKFALDHVEPKVTRRLDVPRDLRLDRLHLVIGIAIGWTNTHLYEFRVRDVGCGIPDPDWDYIDWIMKKIPVHPPVA